MVALPKGQLGQQGALEAKRLHNMQEARSSSLYQEASSSSLLGRAGSLMGTALNLAAFLPMIGGAVGLASKVKFLSGLKNTSEVMKLPNATFGAIHATAQEALGAEHKVSQAIGNHGSKLMGFAQKTLGRSSLGSKALENIKDRPVLDVVINAGFAVRQASSAVLSVRDKVRTLKQMQKDITGEDVSTLSIMMGSKKLDPLVAKARKEVMGGRGMAGTGLQIAGAAGNAYLAFFDKSSGKMGLAKAMAIGAAPDMAASFITSGNTTLQAYRDMTLSFAQTGKADVQLYEGLIGGLNQGASPKLVNELAGKAYESQLSAKEVLQMVSEMSKPGKKSFAQAEQARRNTRAVGGLAPA